MPKEEIEIIYQDDEIFIINKPSGISVTKDRAGAPKLVDVLAEQLGADVAGGIRIVHRLDKLTSGVMMLARTGPMRTTLTDYFVKKLFRKTYLAIVAGFVPYKDGRVEAPLGPHPKKPGRMCITPGKGKDSITHWKLLADFGAVALLAVRPFTGRTHQIRVHLPSVGMPLAVDPLYGSGQALYLSDFKTGYRLARDKVEKPLIERLTLHAYQIEFLEPLGDRPDCFVGKLDKKFAAAIKMLTKHNPQGLDAFTDPDNFDLILKAGRLPP